MAFQPVLEGAWRWQDRKGSAAACAATSTVSGVRVVPGSPWIFEHLIRAQPERLRLVDALHRGHLGGVVAFWPLPACPAVLGFVQAGAIGLAVANADGGVLGYLLMMALRGDPGAGTSRPACAAATFGWVLAGYGALVASGHIGATFADDSNGTWWGPLRRATMCWRLRPQRLPPVRFCLA